MYRIGRSRSVPIAPVARRNGAIRCALESLESRVFLNATLTSRIGAVEAVMNSSPTQIDLTAHFSDPSVTGTTVLIQTTEGNIPIELFGDAQIATTVQNFLSYVNSGAYTNTFFHRVVTVDTGGIGIVQGGGYDTSLNHIATSPPIPLQYDFANTTGTIAMARTTDPNSATSEFFFNTTDNTDTLGPTNGGGYSVFGQVIYNGMEAVDTIYGLPQTSATAGDGASLDSIPLQNYTSGQTPTISNLVLIKSASVVSPLLFSATSDNPALVNPTISNGTLSLNYGAGQAGTANIVVSAMDLGGNLVSDTIQVTVGSMLGGRGPRTLRFTDADGTATTVSLAGPGTADVRFTGANVSQALSHGVLTVTGSGVFIQSIALSGTTAGSTLSVAGRGGDRLVEIDTISSDGSMHAISAPQASVSSDISIAGSIANITLAQATNGSLTIGGAAGNLVLNIGAVSGETINSSQAVQLQGTSWGVSSAVTISAPSVRTITARGEFDVTLNAGAVANVTVGSISSGTWAVAGSVGNITAGSISGLTLSANSIGRLTSRGALMNTTATSVGNIAAISAASIAGSKFAAGSPPLDQNGLATSFPNPGVITMVTVGRGGFSNSALSAPTLGRLSLGGITSTNGGIPFGLAAGDILSLLATVDGKKLSLKNVTTSDEIASAIASASITPNDLVIRIV